jgi:hypothetical protein
MATDRERRELNATHPDVEKEPSDVSVGGIAGFLVGLALCVGLVALVLYGAFNALTRAFNETPQNLNALAGKQEPLPPERMPGQFPEPRLQTDYFGDLAKMRQSWNEQLNSYGWVDRNAGILHIPIEQAIALTAQRGLPSRATEQPNGTAAQNQRPGVSSAKGKAKQKP